ncbi:MAG: hypothetical protein ACKOEO_20600 [Planctomycetaceae bacterium]
MQTMPETMLESLVQLSPRDVMGYAKVRGWRQFRTTGRLMIFNRNETGSLDQLLIPVDSSRPDFGDRMREAVERLVEFEKRPASSIVSDLMNYDSDLLRFRVASSRAQKGTLPLIQAIDLMAGARQSLLAAAHSVLTPRRHHPKLSRGEAVQLLEACQMGQTEQRSFVVSISCPMRAVDAEQAGLNSSELPFARRTTSLLTRALASLDQAIEEDRINSIVDEEDPIVSANLCDALLKMRPVQGDGLLEFIPSWAPSEPIDLDVRITTRSIVFSSDEFEPIEDIYRQLRPTEESLTKPWIAFVDELRGTEGDAGAREGEVVFTIFDDDQIIRARATLNREQYQMAYEAHNPARPLFIHGHLNRGPRVSRLTQITELRPTAPAERQPQ